MSMSLPSSLRVSFFVPGTPRPQGSKRAFVNKKTGQPIITESGGRNLGDWRGDVKRAAMATATDPLEGPVVVSLAFSLTRPKSHPKTKVTYPSKRPDIDKLARSVLDAITAVCFLDDAQIVDLAVTKSWGSPPGVQVAVEPFAESVS